MADFGTSTKKFSLASLDTRQNVKDTTARDVNTLLGTVAKGIEDYQAIQDNEDTTSLNKAYNQLQVAYNNQMTNAGDDLGLQTEAYDTFRASTDSLMNTTGMSDKVLTRFNSVALNDISRIRGKHDAIRNAYNENRFYDSVATDAVTFKSLSLEDKQAWFKEKQSVGGLYQLTSAQVSEQLVKAMSNTQKAMYDSETTTLEQLELMKKDIEGISTIDDKVVGKPYYNQALADIGSLILGKKQHLERVLAQELNSKELNEKQKLDKIQQSVWLSNDKKNLYTVAVKNEAFNTKLVNTAGNFSSVMSNFEVPMSTVRVMGKNRMALDPSYSREDYESDVFKAEQDRQKFTKSQNTINVQQQKNMATQVLNEIKSRGDFTQYTPEQIDSFILTSTGDSAISEANFSFSRRYKVGHQAYQSGLIESFSNYKGVGALTNNDTSWYEGVSKSFVNELVPTLPSGSAQDVYALAGIISRTRQVGNIKNVLSNMLDGTTVKTADELKTLSDNIGRTSILLNSNPEKVDKLLDADSKKRYYIYSSLMAKNAGVLTQPQVDKVEMFLSTPEYKNFKPSSSKGQDSLSYFMSKWNGEDKRTLSYDQETFMAMKEFGMSDKEAVEVINSRYKVTKGDNYSFSGVDAEKANFKDLEDNLKKFSSKVGEYDKEAYFTVNEAGEIMIGTKNAPAQRNMGLHLETQRDSDGNYIHMGLEDTMNLLERIGLEDGTKTFLGSEQGARNLHKLQAFTSDILSEYPTREIQKILTGDTFYQRAIKDIFAKAFKGVKGIAELVNAGVKKGDEIILGEEE